MKSVVSLTKWFIKDFCLIVHIQICSVDIVAEKWKEHFHIFCQKMAVF